MAKEYQFNWRPQIPEILLKGDVFDRYDDETTTLDIGCTARIDEYGFYIVWEPKGKDAGVLDFLQVWEARPSGTIKDLRVLFDLEQRSTKESVEERTVWVTYGQDLVNVNNLYLIAKTAQIAQEWRQAINNLVHNYKLGHSCPTTCLTKHWRYLCLTTNERGKIPLKNIIKTFSSGKPERMVQKCLTDLGLAGDKFVVASRVRVPCSWSKVLGSLFRCNSKWREKQKEREELDASLFTFEKFLRLYHKICPRTDVQELFVKLSGQKEYLTREKLIQFLNEEQRDPRLNEILFPFFNHERVQQLIEKYETDESYIAQGKMSGDGFLRFLMSDENAPVFLDRTNLHQDMDQPLCHYYINSSHNTYLIGRQYGGKSSTEIYRQVLLSGCRCIELDCWDGTGENKGEPIITHGKAMCTDVFFKDVLYQIRDTAFSRSDFPVILSFENHCSKSNQLKMAKYCMEIFGDLLLGKPLDEFPLEPGVLLPSPNRLRRKILIKNKRLRPEVEKHQLEQFLREGKLDEEDDMGETPEVVGEDTLPSRNPDDYDFLTDEERTSLHGSPSASYIGGRLTPSSSRSVALGVCSRPSSRNSSPRNSIDLRASLLFAAFDKKCRMYNKEHSMEKSIDSPGIDRSNSSRSFSAKNSRFPLRHATSSVRSNASPPLSAKIAAGQQQTPPSQGLNEDQRAHPEQDPNSQTPPLSADSKEFKDLEEAHPELKQQNFIQKLKPFAKKNTDGQDPDDASNIGMLNVGGLSREKSEKRSFRRNSGSQDHSISAALLDSASGPKRQVSTRQRSKKPVLTKEEEERIFAEYHYTGATTNIHPLLSSLINYTHPVKFSGFNYAEDNNCHFHMSSFSESTGLGYLKQNAPEFVNYNKRQLSRIYPKGARVDSSNFLPQIFWNAGCQMVALNFQTSDVCMQLNQGKFEYNGQCGYLLKPDFMRRPDRSFDPFSESPVDGVIAAHCSVRVISGQFLCDRKVGTYVEVEMYGLPTDTIRKEHRTKTVPANGLNPIYNEEPFVFRKVVLPELAVLRFAVYDENGKQLGQRILPLDGLQAGFRHIGLRTETNMPMTLPTLFVHIVIKTYVPDELSGLVDALADPKAYLSAQEKRKEALHNMGVEEADIVEVPADVANEKEKVTQKQKSDPRTKLNGASSPLSQENRQNSGIISHQKDGSFKKNDDAGENKFKRAYKSIRKSIRRDPNSLLHPSSATPGMNRKGTRKFSPERPGSRPQSPIEIIAPFVRTSSPTPSGVSTTSSTLGVGVGAPDRAPTTSGSIMRKLTPSSMWGNKGPGSEYARQSFKHGGQKLKVETINLCELKKDKSFHKLAKKLQKDMEELKKKHQKQRDAIQKQQQSTVDKMMSDSHKMSKKESKKNNLQYTSSGNGTSRHASLSGKSSDSARSPNAISDMANNQKMRSLVSTQMDEWSKLVKKQQEEEFELRKAHIKEEFDMLRKLLADAQKQQMSALKTKLEVENKELKQSQTKKSIEDAKLINQDKNIKTKAERDRRIKELNEKNVKVFMEERKRFSMKTQMHEEQLSKRHTEQTEALEREAAKALEIEDFSHRESLLAARPESVV